MLAASISTTGSRLLLGASAAAVIAVSVAAGMRHSRAIETQRLVADIDLIASAEHGYGLESQKVTVSSDDTAWKEYCYRQRASLIQEARDGK